MKKPIHASGLVSLKRLNNTDNVINSGALHNFVLLSSRRLKQEKCFKSPQSVAQTPIYIDGYEEAFQAGCRDANKFLSNPTNGLNFIHKLLEKLEVEDENLRINHLAGFFERKQEVEDRRQAVAEKNWRLNKEKNDRLDQTS